MFTYLFFGIIIFLIFAIILKYNEQKAYNIKKQELDSFEFFHGDNPQRPFKVLGEVSAQAFNSEVQLKFKLMDDAKSMGADAVIKYQQNSNTSVSGGVSTTSGILGGKKVSGSTSSFSTFYGNGVAVKYISEEEAVSLNFDEDKYYEQLMLAQNLFEKKLIDQVEYEEKIAQLKNKKEIAMRHKS